MTETGLESAVTRLERAIARVERAAIAASGGREAALARLAERHDRLRGRVQEAIGRLDAVIAADPAGGTDG